MGIIYIVRHGQTVWNAEGRIQGHSDIGLSETGQRQAQAIARRLADVHFDVAYCSDLSRTTETARIILGERDIPLHPTPKLREYKKGVFEGLTEDEYRQQYPELYEASLVNDLDFAPPGGETIRQTSARMGDFIDDLQCDHPEDRALVVGHGGSLRAAIVALLSLPLEANWKFAMGNCALSIIATYPENAVLYLYNDTSHLKGLG
jgi:broad specificity phosphatase PhoE